jgi:hypothetical protein
MKRQLHPPTLTRWQRMGQRRKILLVIRLHRAVRYFRALAEAREIRLKSLLTSRSLRNEEALESAGIVWLAIIRLRNVPTGRDNAINLRINELPKASTAFLLFIFVIGSAERTADVARVD